MAEKRAVKPTAKVAAAAAVSAVPAITSNASGRSAATTASLSAAASNRKVPVVARREPEGVPEIGVEEDASEKAARARGANWPDLPTKVLIKTYAEMESEFESKSERHTTLWDEVANKVMAIMSGLNFTTTGQKCNARYQAVKTAYKVRTCRQHSLRTCLPKLIDSIVA